jgi:hypothetical protein
MAWYASARACRRQLILCYFGESSASHCASCDVCAGLHVEPRARPAARRRGGKLGATHEVSWDLHARGLSADEIAAARRLAPETVLGHLADLAEAGWAVERGRAVRAERAAQILEAARHAAPLLEAIKRALPPDFLFNEIRLVLAVSRRRSAQPGRQGAVGAQEQQPHQGGLQHDERQRERREQQPVPERREPPERDRAQVGLEHPALTDGEDRQPVQEALQQGAVANAGAPEQLGGEADAQVGDTQAPSLPVDHRHHASPDAGAPR